jgi:IS1 family transposase
MTNLPTENVECDEIWGFVGCKQKTNNRIHKGYEFGDAYCFTAIERDSKLMVAWHLGKRSPQDAKCFADRLRYVTSGRFQVSTDGYGPYTEAVPNAFDDQVDFAQLIKIYHQPKGPEGRYSPAEIAEIHTKVICGNPNPDLICTSHVERQNLNIRMGIRRMTRLTNAFSKKWENHEAHLAIYFLYYNFCRVHQTLKTTPAVAHGLSDRVWSIERLLDELTKV